MEIYVILYYGGRATLIGHPTEPQRFSIAGVYTTEEAALKAIRLLEKNIWFEGEIELRVFETDRDYSGFAKHITDYSGRK